jgi:hypothetical protein
MARNYKRDRRGRFARVAANRRGRKIKRLTAKNNRVVREYSQQKSLHGTPFGNSIERSVIKRAVKINRLKARNSALRGTRVR